jgi:hypothetical protein
MPVNYQQMHASNQEIIDFFQDEQVVADLLEQFNQVADDYNSDSDSDYQEESDNEDGEISESDSESDEEEDEKENVNPVSQPITPPTQIISLPPHPPQLIRQRNTNNDGITWYIQPIIGDMYEVHTPRQNQETNNREVLSDLSNITIRSRRRLHFN